MTKDELIEAIIAAAVDHIKVDSAVLNKININVETFSAEAGATLSRGLSR